MKIRNMSACALATALGTLPLAHGAPPLLNGTQVFQFRATNDSVQGAGCSGNVCASFVVAAFDDRNGVRKGFAQVQIFDLSDPNQFSQINCFGQAYADSVSLDKIRRTATVSATLNPASTDCSPSNVPAPITLNLAGQYNGNFNRSAHGNFKDEFFGVITTGTFTDDDFSETFNGSVGAVLGPFEGGAFVTRKVQQQRVK